MGAQYCKVSYWRRQLPEQNHCHTAHTDTLRKSKTWRRRKRGIQDSMWEGRGEFFLCTKRSINKIFICFLPLVNWTNLQCPEYANVIANKWLGWSGGNERAHADKDRHLIPWQEKIYMEENLPNIFASKVPICLFEARQGKVVHQRMSAAPTEPPSANSALPRPRQRMTAAPMDRGFEIQVIVYPHAIFPTRE